MWESADEAANQANDELAEQAAQLGVSTTVAGIDATVVAISAYAEALAEVRSAARALSDAATARDQAAERATEANEFRIRKESEHRNLRAQAASLRSKYDSLKDTVAASVAELQGRLGEITAAIRDGAEKLKQIVKEQLTSAAEHRRSKETVRELERRREETATGREEKIGCLRDFTATRLLRVALPEFTVPAPDAPEEWNVTAAVSLSRNAEQQLHEVDESDDSWGRAQQRVSSASTELAIIARRAVGDAHALDVSRPLGRLSVSVIRAAFLPDEAVSDGESSPRDVWAAAGVVLSNLASTVLCLGVPGLSPDSGIVSHPSQTGTASSLEAMRAARMPVLLTLDQVRSGGVQALPHGSVIHICENPTVVEVVADRWARITAVAGTSGAGGPVLVCTSGQPSTAVVELLRRLTGEGAECRYHGDFDWAGLRIARSLSAHVKWTPWRFEATDYRAALRDGKPSLRLAGSPAGSP